MIECCRRRRKRATTHQGSTMMSLPMMVAITIESSALARSSRSGSIMTTIRPVITPHCSHDSMLMTHDIINDSIQSVTYVRHCERRRSKSFVGIDKRHHLLASRRRHCAAITHPGCYSCIADQSVKVNPIYKTLPWPSLRIPLPCSPSLWWRDRPLLRLQRPRLPEVSQFVCLYRHTLKSILC